jgi:hypothetical protein
MAVLHLEDELQPKQVPAGGQQLSPILTAYISFTSNQWERGVTFALPDIFRLH